MALLKSFKDNLHHARGLSLSDWSILTEAWLSLPFFHMALKWMSYERFANSFGDGSDRPADPVGALLLAQKYHRLIHWASRLHILPLSCLDRSLTLHWMLSRRNLPAQVRIGVSKSPTGVYAHAWVEVVGETVGEGTDVLTRFAKLESSEVQIPFIERLEITGLNGRDV